MHPRYDVETLIAALSFDRTHIKPLTALQTDQVTQAAEWVNTTHLIPGSYKTAFKSKLAKQLGLYYCYYTQQRNLSLKYLAIYLNLNQNKPELYAEACSLIGAAQLLDEKCVESEDIEEGLDLSEELANHLPLQNDVNTLARLSFAMQQMAQLKRRSGHDKEAEKILQCALSLTDRYQTIKSLAALDEAECLFQLGCIAEKQNDIDDALKLYDKSLNAWAKLHVLTSDKQPGFYLTLLAKTQILFTKQRFSETKALLAPICKTKEPLPIVTSRIKEKILCLFDKTLTQLQEYDIQRAESHYTYAKEATDTNHLESAVLHYQTAIRFYEKTQQGVPPTLKLDYALVLMRQTIPAENPATIFVELDTYWSKQTNKGVACVNFYDAFGDCLMKINKNLALKHYRTALAISHQLDIPTQWNAILMHKITQLESKSAHHPASFWHQHHLATILTATAGIGIVAALAHKLSK